MIRPVMHLLLHIAVPAAVAGVAWRERFLKTWLVLVATMIVDVDHLLADPVYDPTRCSIGFHPLHQPAAIALYVLAAAWPRTRVVGVGLLIHMLLDGIDCAWMRYE